jgi:mRNA interferase RelE/StbE
VSTWKVLLTPKAAKELKGIERAQQSRIVGAIELLRQHPYPPKAQKLATREAWRIRVGDYRVIYTVEGTTVTITVIRIAHRRDVYRSRL